jgi:DNA (cytosine-5)-methyltransferase 1
MKKYKAIDLFCGAGGLSLGLKRAGFNVKLGLDIDRTALQTYKNNFRKVKVIEKNIKDISGEKLLEISKIEKGSNFLLAGCPPCQGFSKIGKRDPDDEKNQLIFEYIRLIQEMEPSFILMENVPGMSKRAGKLIFSKALEELEEKYYLKYDTLNAADYGVPQVRKRLVLHGIRKNVYMKLKTEYSIDIEKVLPVQTHTACIDSDCILKKWITVGEAIGDLPKIEAGELYDEQILSNHVARQLSDINRLRLDYIRKNGKDRSCLKDEHVLKCHKNSSCYKDTYGVMDEDKPSPTLTGGCTSITKGRFGHPTQNRGISIREAARLQSFDDTFQFSGSLQSMSLQIGNAIPPNLAEASGKKIIKLMDLYNTIVKRETIIKND